MSIGFLPEIPSFSKRLAQTLGASLGEGYEGFRSGRSERQRRDLLGSFSPQRSRSYEDLAPKEQESVGSAFGDIAQSFEEGMGRELSSQDLDQLWSGLQQQQQQAQSSEPNWERSMQNAMKATVLGDKDLAQAFMKQATLNQKNEMQSRKETKPVVDSIIAGHEAAQVSKASLDRMEKLEESNLAGPYTAALADTLGIPLSILSNPESEEFEKLVAQRGLNVAQAYGFGRILQTEYENFLRTIPSLKNTKEGRSRIRETLRYFDSLANKRYEAFKRIKKQSGGKLPIDLQERIAEEMEPEYEELREKLVQGSSKPAKVTSSLESIFG